MRHKFLVHPRFQSFFTFHFFIGSLFIITILGFVSFGTLYILGNHPFLTGNQRLMIFTHATKLALITAAVGFLPVLAATVAGFFLSHRHIGPLERLEKELETVDLESVKNLKLRTGDDLAPLIPQIIRLLEKYKASLKS